LAFGRHTLPDLGLTLSLNAARFCFSPGPARRELADRFEWSRPIAGTVLRALQQEDRRCISRGSEPGEGDVTDKTDAAARHMPYRWLQGADCVKRRPHSQFSWSIRRSVEGQSLGGLIPAAMEKSVPKARLPMPSLKLTSERRDGAPA
jgi:hypothetical protein